MKVIVSIMEQKMRYLNRFPLKLGYIQLFSAGRTRGQPAAPINQKENPAEILVAPNIWRIFSASACRRLGKSRCCLIFLGQEQQEEPGKAGNGFINKLFQFLRVLGFFFPLPEVEGQEGPILRSEVWVSPLLQRSPGIFFVVVFQKFYSLEVCFVLFYSLGV